MTGIYRLTVPEARSLRSGCWPDWLLLRACGEQFVSCVGPSFWQHLLYLSLYISALIFIRCSSFLHLCVFITLFKTRTQVLWSQGPLYDFILTNYVRDSSVSKWDHILRYWNWDFDMNFRETAFSPQSKSFNFNEVQFIKYFSFYKLCFWCHV